MKFAGSGGGGRFFITLKTNQEYGQMDNVLLIPPVHPKDRHYDLQ